MKRQPTLADLALALPHLPHGPARWHEQTRERLRLAERFVLDDDAARYLGRMIHESPRVIADANDFAIPPFEHMWIEMPLPSFHEEVSIGLQNTPEDFRYADKRVGYLFSGPVVRVVACGDDSGDAGVGVMPVEYLLHQPLTEDEQVEVADAVGVSRLGLDLWFWGATSTEFIHCNVVDESRQHEWDKEGLRALRNNHGVRVFPFANDQHVIAEGAWPRIVNSSSGDLRNIVALLLYLNRTRDITIQYAVPMGEAFIKRKQRPLLSHRVITLKLDPMPRLRTLSAGLGVQRRLHDVRGCFCHDKVARQGCPHGIEHAGDFGEWWEEYEPLRWRCTGCWGKRWWRPEHKRGSKNLGEIIHTYEVTK